MFGVLARVGHFLRGTVHCVAELSSDGLGLLVRMVRSRAAVARTSYLRKQLAFYQEHEIQPNRFTDAARGACLLVTVVRLERSPEDRPTGNAYRVASERVQTLLAREIQNGETAASREDPPADRADGARESELGTGGVAAELSLKLGIIVSPRTVRSYWPAESDPRKGSRCRCTATWR
jgi:hypothetical protein